MDGCQRVRVIGQSSSRTIADTTSAVRPGLILIWRSTRDPRSTLPQKMSVALVPTRPLAGTVKLVLRQLSSAQVNGRVQRRVRLGPTGPLKKAACFSPQRPSNPSHGYSATAAAGSDGTVRMAGLIVRDGPRVSSQPRPSASLRIRYSRDP